MSDVISRIDELIDEQLESGEPINGYDYGDPDYPRCGHCGRHWHGLPITEHIATTYQWGTYDPNYRLADDDSPVLCEGSDFIGPQRRPLTERATILNYLAHRRREDRQREPHVSVTIAADMVRVLEQVNERWREMASRMAELTAIPQTVFSPIAWTFAGGNWQPEPRADPDTATVTFGPQWWHCEMQHPPTQRRPLRRIRRYDSNWTLGYAQVYQTPHTPLERALQNQWHRLTAPNYPIPNKPGYDFSQWNNEHPHNGPSRPAPNRRTATR